MDTVTFQKLKDIESRLDHVQGQMSDPAVAQDPSAYQKLAREAKDITPLADRYRAYKDTLGEITKVQEMIRTETDPELREMAHEELRTLEARKGELEEQIRLLLVPKDPNDEKNVLLEIRAGTGGEEAALFAAEVFRMYQRYAERQRWKMDIVSITRAGQGGIKE
ncbi:MAG TPA: PCRF domain-containing protein, partial [Vicinamibacteria bacterium]|nr:PCRF domain-containing protein [Vicinamibacteria bacterium]